MHSVIFFITLVATILITVCAVSYAIKLATRRININKHLIDLSMTLPISILAVAFIIYVIPSYTPIVTMKNGAGQKLVFIGIQHIGIKSYYEDINDRLLALRGNGFTILHEGVGMSGNVTVTLKSCSRVTDTESPHGVVTQPNCIGQLHPGDIYADIQYEDFLTLYAQQLQDTLGVTLAEAKTMAKAKPSDIKSEVDSIKTDFIHYFAAKLVAMHKSSSYFITTKWKSDDKASPVIMTRRNQILSHYISANQLSATAYGMAHISGVVEILKEKDPSWTVEKVDGIRSL